MNEETFIPSDTSSPEPWGDANFDPRQMASRIDELEEALNATMGVISRQQSLLTTTGFAQKMAQDLGRPEGAALLAQELTAIPGLTEAAAQFPLLGDMAKAWAAQKLHQGQMASLKAGEAPLPTTITGELGQGSGSSGRQKQLANDLQKMASDLGLELDEKDALEVYSGV